MRYLLHILAAFVTQKPRRMLVSGVDFKWSDRLWVHDVFRVWELFFGYPCIEITKKRKGCVERWYVDEIAPSIGSFNGLEVAYSFEAQLALFEVMVRRFFARNFAYKLVRVPQLQLAGMSNGGLVPYRFAIAFDSTSGVAGNTSTQAHTMTGANTILNIFALGDTADNLTGITYATVAASFGTKIQFPTDRFNYAYFQTGSTTGTNNIVASGLTFCELGAISYTGASQTGQPDSVNTVNQSGAASTTHNLTTTVVNTGSWIWGACYGPLSFTSGTGTVRGTTTNGVGMADSNGIVSTGLQTVTITTSNDAGVQVVMSFKPVGSGGGSTPQFVVPPPFIGN